MRSKQRFSLAHGSETEHSVNHDTTYIKNTGTSFRAAHTLVHHSRYAL